MTTAPPPHGQGQPQPAAGQPAGPTNVVITQPAIVTVAPMTDSPMNMTCPYCRQQIVTSTVHEAGTFTWFACVALCLLGCILCSFIPFLVESCQDTVHSCPYCRATIGRHKGMS